MSYPVLINEERRKNRLLIEKQAAVGGDYGHFFDSGSNYFNLLKIHIEYDQSAIKGISFYSAPFGFVEGKHSGFVTGKYSSPSYQKTDVAAGSNERRTFVILPGDSVVKIDVWATDDNVTAVQFHNMSGLFSELYGCPHHANCTHSFKATRPGSRLLGFHGRFGEAVHKLGFTFASLVYDENGLPDPKTEKRLREMMSSTAKENEISQNLRRRQIEYPEANVPNNILIPQLPEEKKRSVPERNSSVMEDHETSEKETKKSKK